MPSTPSRAPRLAPRSTTVDLRPPRRLDERDAMRAEVLAGLCRRPRTIPSKYFYDTVGSQLFERISALPEYYLTRVERAILERDGARIAAALPEGRVTVVDLGAGDGSKTRLLLERCRDRGLTVEYAPVDVSTAALDDVARRMADDLPGLPVTPIAGEYTRALDWLRRTGSDGSLLVLFLGSSIGNMSMAEARRFLAQLASSLRPGDHLFVGFDRVKDPRVLQAAYDDAAGITAEFNLNLLDRLNRDLGADFDRRAFRHHEIWSPTSGAMESYLVSTRVQTVRIGDVAVRFDAWEAVRTEISMKYRDRDLASLARAAGLVEVGRFEDEARAFVDVLWSVPPKKPPRRR